MFALIHAGYICTGGSNRLLSFLLSSVCLRASPIYIQLHHPNIGLESMYNNVVGATKCSSQ